MKRRILNTLWVAVSLIALATIILCVYSVLMEIRR